MSISKLRRGKRKSRKGLRGGTTGCCTTLNPALIVPPFSGTALPLNPGDFGPPHARAIAGGWLADQGGPLCGGKKKRGKRTRRAGRKSRRGYGETLPSSERLQTRRSRKGSAGREVTSSRKIA